MFNIVLCVVLAFLALGTVLLQKAYNEVPVRELKRRVQEGDPLATLMHRAVGYEISLQVLLWIFVAVTNAAFVVAMARYLNLALSIVLIISWLWLVLVLVPASNLFQLTPRLASYATPSLAWILNYGHPILMRIGRFINTLRPDIKHTRLYQKEDLIDLLERQAKQTDNRMTHQELEMAAHALNFGARLVRDHMTPLSQVVTVNDSEEVGPILMDRLHKSGHSRFPVTNSESKITGTLFLRDLVGKTKGGKVSGVAKSDVFYVHENQTLYQTLMAALKTKHHLFVVVNEFEETVGIITLEDVLEQVIGMPIIDEFDQYDDLRAVAAHHAKAVHTQQKHEKVIPENPEVIQ